MRNRQKLKQKHFSAQLDILSGLHRSRNTSPPRKLTQHPFQMYHRFTDAGCLVIIVAGGLEGGWGGNRRTFGSQSSCVKIMNMSECEDLRGFKGWARAPGRAVGEHQRGGHPGPNEACGERTGMSLKSGTENIPHCHPHLRKQSGPQRAFLAPEAQQPFTSAPGEPRTARTMFIQLPIKPPKILPPPPLIN